MLFFKLLKKLIAHTSTYECVIHEYELIYNKHKIIMLNLLVEQNVYTGK